MEVLTKDQLWRNTLRREPTRTERLAGTPGMIWLALFYHRLTLTEILMIAAGVVTLCIVAPICWRMAGWWGISGLIVWAGVCGLLLMAVMIGKREPPRR